MVDRSFIYTIRAQGVTEYMGYMHNLLDVESPPLQEDNPGTSQRPSEDDVFEVDQINTCKTGD